MSRIDELIERLCPDGVEYKELGEVCDLARGVRVVKKNLSETGEIPVFQNALKPLGFHSEGNRHGEMPFVICAGAAGQIGYSATPFWAADDCFTVESAALNSRYLYHLLLSNQSTLLAQVRKASIPRLSRVAIEKLRIPVPPMEVQEEIVRVLDSFAELEVELEAELEARKAQYVLALNALMTFDNTVPRIAVGDLFEFKNGLNKGKEFFGHGTPIVNYVDVYRGGRLTSSSIKGLVEASEKDISCCDAHLGDVFFTRTSETKDEIGKTAALIEEIPDCVFSGFLLRARPKTGLLDPGYCAYCFETHDIRKWIVAHSSYTTRALTNGKILSKLMIPVPSLEKQREIAGILDALYALVNDISAGLPAEIAARRKQYEYYRDKLLTFKEKTA